MSRLSKAALITFVVATLAGSCLHFVYALWPNGLTALLAQWRRSRRRTVRVGEQRRVGKLYMHAAGGQVALPDRRQVGRGGAAGQQHCQRKRRKTAILH